MYLYGTVRNKFAFSQPSPGLHDMYRLLFRFPTQPGFLPPVSAIVKFVIVFVDDDYLYNLIMDIKQFITAVFSSR